MNVRIQMFAQMEAYAGIFQEVFNAYVQKDRYLTQSLKYAKTKTNVRVSNKHLWYIHFHRDAFYIHRIKIVTDKL